ncbi:MAG: methyltransferase [Kofleriaceae bacterium]|nr:methyltransferase [Kofleriaceae bacterium]
MTALHPDDELTVDALTGGPTGWSITQRRRGHRHSTDDLLTGWYAGEVLPGARRLLDLGTGIGSVGLIALWRSPPDATLVAIEAQEISFALLEANIARNGLATRVRPIHADLRDVRLDEKFELVTGSPPYWDVSWGVVPADSQKAHARFELRGDVRDYAHAARAALADNGRFVFCFPTVQRARAEAACTAADLAITRSRDVIPRAGAAPLFTLFAARRAEDGDEPHVREPDHLVRDATGAPTPAHLAARAALGFAESRERPA